MRPHNLYILVCMIGTALASCKGNSSFTPAYPATLSNPTSIQKIETTELPSEAYPALQTSVSEAVRFEFDRPVKAGTTIITGNAPAGVVINILNVTLMGELLGSGVVDANNRFAISVPPLTENIRIGIEVADTGSSSHTYEDFYNESYKGEGALMFPQIGYFQDTVMVGP